MCTFNTLMSNFKCEIGNYKVPVAFVTLIMAAIKLILCICIRHDWQWQLYSLPCAIMCTVFAASCWLAQEHVSRYCQHLIDMCWCWKEIWHPHNHLMHAPFGGGSFLRTPLTWCHKTSYLGVSASWKYCSCDTWCAMILATCSQVGCQHEGCKYTLHV